MTRLYYFTATTKARNMGIQIAYALQDLKKKKKERNTAWTHFTEVSNQTNQPDIEANHMDNE